MREPIKLTVLPGDGVGPEVTDEAVRAVRAALFGGTEVVVKEYPFGGAALDEIGDPFPVNTRQAVEVADAVLLGSVGGPKWDHVELDQRPEAGLLQLRRFMDVFANLRPVVVDPVDADASPLKREIADGVDVLIVRELTSGIYFGEPRRTIADGDDPTAIDTMVYTVSQIQRVARIAFERARARKGRVTSIDKANVLASSRLWRSTVTELQQNEFEDVGLDHLYVDNAAMQLVTKPSSFDVILCGNLFGDILSDLCAVLPGSLGVLPSASIGSEHALFEPVHGSAPDIAGSGVANPIGSILSAAMLLDYLGESEAAENVRRAVRAVRNSGFGTADMASASQTVSTQEFGTLVVQQLSAVVEAT